MTLELALLTLAALAEPSCHVGPARMQAIVEEADRASRRHGVPVGLVLAVVLAESGGRNIISRRRKCGGRDAGPMQVHTHDTHRRRLALLLARSTNLDIGAHLLSKSRERCSRPRSGCRCLESHYNWGGRTRWCGRVHRIWSRLMRRVRPGGVT